MQQGQLPSRGNRKEQMGWLTPEEQKDVLQKYHVVASFMCDTCEKPINNQEMPVIDTKKGYHKWTRRTPKNCRQLCGRAPRVTYHQGTCDRTPFGRKRYKKLQKQIQIMKQIEKGEYEMTKNKKKDKSKKKASAKKTVKSNPKCEKAVLALVTKKENHYTKQRLIAKLKDKFEKSEIRAAITALWSDKKIRKDTGKLKYYLYKGKGKSKKSEDASDEEDE